MINLEYAEFSQVQDRSNYPTWARRLSKSEASIEVVSKERLDVKIHRAPTKGVNGRLIPSLSFATEIPYGYQASLVYKEGEKELLANLCQIGKTSQSYALPEASNESVKSDIDLFLLQDGLPSHSIVFRVWTTDAAQLALQHCVATVSEQTETPGALESMGYSPVEALAVPRESQMQFAESIRRRICSPTSIAMVLGYFGLASSVEEIAEASYHTGHDMYGIWPQAIWAMSRPGMCGYVCRIRGYRDVSEFLSKGIPLIASINYKQGELTNAAIDQTPGHLVVITGIDDNFVYVNDPAAMSEEDVSRAYDLVEFGKAWLLKKGVAYVPIRAG
jgi:uncharacterized protein YvpB